MAPFSPPPSDEFSQNFYICAAFPISAQSIPFFDSSEMSREWRRSGKELLLEDFLRSVLVERGREEDERNPKELVFCPGPKHLHAIVMVVVNCFFFFVGTLTKMPCEEIISSPIGEEKGMIVAFGPCCFANRVLEKKKERKGDTVPLPLVVNNLKLNHHDRVLNHPLEIMCGEDSDIL